MTALGDEESRLPEQLAEVAAPREALSRSSIWRLPAPLRSFGAALSWLRTSTHRAASTAAHSLPWRAAPDAPSPAPISVREEAGIFDRSWYLAAYPDVAEAGIDPYEHYQAHGKEGGRHPTTSAGEEALGFDRGWYLAAYPDVATAGQDPFRHWLEHGKADGRHFNAHASFSPRELAVLAKSYHFKDHESAPSPELAIRIPVPKQPTSTFDSAQYWRDRYRAGGNSGAGSYGRLANFKAEIVNAFVREHDIASVIEFGCGDGAQLTLADYPTYLGFDVANESIELCRSKFALDPTKEFRNAGTWDYENADLTLSLDVIFHLIEDDVFHDYMRRLFFSAKRYVIVYSSNHEAEHAATHVKHRRFTDWVQVYHANFKLVRHIPNRWPLADDDQSQSFADFFVFEKLPTRKHTLPGHLVVSLTSYSKRFPTLELTLRRILQQSIQPDEIVLWLTDEDKRQLPEGVLALQRCGIIIRVSRDLRSYKKIIPAFEHYANSYVITLDDDTAYPLDTIEPLVANYRSPGEILCRRANRVTFDESGNPKPYNQWQFETPHETGLDLVATGVGGILYPPHALAPEVLDEATFTRLAPMADDIWLFWMEHLAGCAIRRVGPRYALQPWPGCHEQGLWMNHNANGGNDRAIAALTARYGSPFRQGFVHISNTDGET